jgi:hypothetical protein
MPMHHDHVPVLVCTISILWNFHTNPYQSSETTQVEQQCDGASEHLKNENSRVPLIRFNKIDHHFISTKEICCKINVLRYVYLYSRILFASSKIPSSVLKVFLSIFHSPASPAAFIPLPQLRVVGGGLI